MSNLKDLYQAVLDGNSRQAEELAGAALLAKTDPA
jgi:hypothetical protein